MLRKMFWFFGLVFLIMVPMSFMGSVKKAESQRRVWSCQYSSAYAVGVGVSSYSRRAAARIALHECQMRTPYYDYCSFDGCW